TVGSWTLSATAGPNTLTATSTGFSGSPVTFSAAGTAGTAATIAANSATRQSATGWEAGRGGPAVSVQDANGTAGHEVGGTVGGGGGDVRGGTGERDEHGRQADDQREWRGDGGELDPERHGGLEYVDGQFRDLDRQPGHVHGDGHSRSGGDDRGERSEERRVGKGGRGGGGRCAWRRSDTAGGSRRG